MEPPKLFSAVVSSWCPSFLPLHLQLLWQKDAPHGQQYNLPVGPPMRDGSMFPCPRSLPHPPLLLPPPPPYPSMRKVLVDTSVALVMRVTMSCELAVASCPVRCWMVAERVVTVLLSATVTVARLVIFSIISASPFALFAWTNTLWPTAVFSRSSWWAKENYCLNLVQVLSFAGRRFHIFRLSVKIPVSWTSCWPAMMIFFLGFWDGCLRLRSPSHSRLDRTGLR